MLLIIYFARSVNIVLCDKISRLGRVINSTPLSRRTGCCCCCRFMPHRQEFGDKYFPLTNITPTRSDFAFKREEQPYTFIRTIQFRGETFNLHLTRSTKLRTWFFGLPHPGQRDKSGAKSCHIFRHFFIIIYFLQANRAKKRKTFLQPEQQNAAFTPSLSFCTFCVREKGNYNNNSTRAQRCASE